jgi:hypothetical protein
MYVHAMRHIDLSSRRFRYHGGFVRRRFQTFGHPIGMRAMWGSTEAGGKKRRRAFLPAQIMDILTSSCPSINEDFCSRSRHVKKITTPVRSAGPTGQAGICLIFRGLFFEHNAEIGPRLNIKYGFNWASKKTIYGWTRFDELVKSPI